MSDQTKDRMLAVMKAARKKISPAIEGRERISAKTLMELDKILAAGEAELTGAPSPYERSGSFRLPMIEG